MKEAMASNVLCGRCGTALSHPMAPCSSCGAQPYYAALARPVRRKSPALAATLAIVPGLGHLYLGEYGKFAGFAAATGLLQFFGFDLDLTGIGAALGVPIEFGGAGVWLFSIFDAYRTARRMNEQA
jgi:hypothetical protein